MLRKNNSRIIPVLLIGLALLIVGCSGEDTANDTTRVFEKIEIDMGAGESISTGSTGNGDVLIELTPHEVIDGTLSVDFSANTHSVDLSSFDLTQITSLEINNKTMNPISAQKLQGHHNSGSIVFEGVEESDTFTITITGIPAVNDRVFQWGTK